MEEYVNLQLNDEHLERLGLEPHQDYWSDIDSKFFIYKLSGEKGYQQFLFDDEQVKKFIINTPLKIVSEIMDRYKSVTGYNLKYYNGDLPINAQ